MTDKLNINQWAEEDRPREKLLANGPEALTDAELLAILIGSGTTKETAVDLMKRILFDCQNNLNTLGRRSIHELTAYKGIGEAKAVTIAAACELGRRRAATKVADREDMGSAVAIYDYMHPRIGELDTEESWVLLMNQRFRLIKAVRLSHGGLTETAVDVRLAIREAVLANATILALSHNHPSGSVLPSREDDRLTECFRKACDIMRLHFADHVIVADGSYYSYREQGKL